MRSLCTIALAALAIALPIGAQTAQFSAAPPEATLRIDSRAVLVDVLVTGRDNKPVKGLKQSAFTVTEQGKPQTISFFEEHTGIAGPPKEMPKLPPNVFSNFSPFPDPPAVNILLLDSLNTGMENQQYVHRQALKFLKSAKPGSRMAVFTMGLGLHFVQGFTDDPSLLLAALNRKSNNELQPSVMIESQSESNANANLVGMMSETVSGGGGTTATAASPAMIAALQNFVTENNASRTTGRALLTMELLEKLATFLNGFPGRKNVIWFSESFPLVREGSDGTQPNVDPDASSAFEKTMAMLAAARVALYPVDARGTDASAFYQAANQLPAANSTPSQLIGSSGAHSAALQAEDVARATARYTEEEMAHQTGGKAFSQTNGLAEVIDDITASSADFYTLSYVPENQKMDGSYRKIEVKVAGGHYNLSYRRGYPATEEALPGSALATRAHEIQKFEARNPNSADPLLAFMDLGMPQSQQILFKVLVKPIAEKPASGVEPAGSGSAGAPSSPAPGAPEAPEAHPAPAAPQAAAPVPPADSTPTTNPEPKKPLTSRYKVDFAIDLDDLKLAVDSDGTHNGALNLSIRAYDRYGNIAARKDTQATLGIKPPVWDIYKKTGLLFSTEIQVPKGQYWLRIGLFDPSSGKVGTLELPLEEVTVARK